MRTNVLLAAAVLFANLPWARAEPVPITASWITRYGNESIQTTDLSTQPRMLRNISNSLMTAAPSFLDDSIYLQRRTNFVSLFPELNGIGETSQEWLRPNRVNISGAGVVVAAVREGEYPGGGALLTGLGWTPLNQTITMNYVAGTAHLALYAGLVNVGPVNISGSGVDQFRSSDSDETNWSHYFFFQNSAAFPPATLAQLNVVSVPEPSTIALMGMGTILIAARFASRRRRSYAAKRIAVQIFGSGSV